MPSPSTTTSEKWPLNVLVVDDERVNRMILVSILSRLVEAVRQAGDGLEALEMVERARPDVVITDLSMPRLDGQGLIERLLLGGNPPKTIVLTAHNEQDFHEPAGAMATSRFLFKPLRLNLLSQTLDQIAAELGLARIPS